MQFLMLVCTDPQGEPAAPGDLTIEEWGADVDRRGVWLAGDRLRPGADSRTVRRRGGATLVTEGPFAEAAEVIGGFDVLECATLEEALEVAAAHPMARAGRIDVRPVWPLGL
ncbi:hypothetical protein FBY24_2950 [Cellulomonas sp. SLBN-39]|nr:hypothetical protein FBY24_2950 [Cellulomonas sp. SLBN-39]